jgi:MFS transporter, ACS family, glucarate transporter
MGGRLAAGRVLADSAAEPMTWTLCRNSAFAFLFAALGQAWLAPRAPAATDAAAANGRGLPAARNAGAHRGWPDNSQWTRFRCDLDGVPVPEIARFGRTDALFSIVYPVYPPDVRAAARKAYRARGYTHWVVDAYPTYRGYYPSGDFGDPAAFTAFMRELVDDGFMPVLAMDAHVKRSDSPARVLSAFESRYGRILADPDARSLIKIAFAGWEADDHMSEEAYFQVLKWLRARLEPDALLFVHFSPFRIAMCKGGDCARAWWSRVARENLADGILYQHQVTDSIERFTGRLRFLVAHLVDGRDGWPSKRADGRPFHVIAFEYDAYWRTRGLSDEATGIRWGTAAMGVPGVSGFCDGGPKEEPSSTQQRRGLRAERHAAGRRVRPGPRLRRVSQRSRVPGDGFGAARSPSAGPPRWAVGRTARVTIPAMTTAAPQMAPTGDRGPATPAAARTNVRWTILAVLFVVTTVNYADRATIAIAGPDIRRVLGLSAVQMGYIFSAFAWSYVAAQLPAGWLLDRFGSKLTYGVALLMWSLFTMFQGSVGFLTGGTAVVALFLLRLAVGAAEAPSFPGNGRLTSAWFPAGERGFASAIFNSAQYFATAFFAPLMGWIVHSFGWQHVFVVMGGLGTMLAVVWTRAIYGPKAHPRVNEAEIDYIRAGGALVELDGATGANPLGRRETVAWLRALLSNRMLVGLYLFQFCVNVLTYFFLTWFPVYLVTERRMTILQAGFVASLPAACGFVGGVLGGWASDRLLRAGWSLSAARKTPIVIGMLMATSMIACNRVDSDVLVVLFMSVAFFGKGIGALGWAVVADTSPREAGGLSGALFNTFGNLAGIVTPIVIGYILQGTGSFAWALVFVGASAATALLSMVFVVGTIERVTPSGVQA